MFAKHEGKVEKKGVKTVQGRRPCDEGEKEGFSRDGVDATGVKRMAAKDAGQAEPRATSKAVANDRLARVLRACREVAADGGV